ncbi:MULTISPECIES: hypothetical protein [unclassified Crossiella]|uniref:hypothetical protein n=1 Tax=unclassified Crossiella TaxID=2620835 RepID=UPI001FFF4A2C|nr:MULTISPECIES: hypothetical protein [unclassified Crossiella]MCK2239728.1 hypothetical protein [Crossiella sp. S99.2]MCK2252423.1 hypothetical protein [Crossiella sp. S99.1]
MSVPDHSRNHTARPGYQLHDAVDLPGWEQQSIWGWDEGSSSFYAQLWRNDSTSDAPEIWLTGARKPYPWPGCIALEIVERTQADALAVVQAMGIAHPEPTLRTENEIMQRAGELNPLRDRGDFVKGQIHALAWTQGLAEFTSGTRTEWGKDRRPTPAQADAEHHMITGRVYLGGTEFDGQDFFNGADEALWWALGR